MHLPASLMTDGFVCRTMLPSASYGLSPWAEEIGPSPAPMTAAGVRRRSTPSSPPPSSTTPIRRLVSPTCWPACRIIPQGASTNSCLGTGAFRASLTPPERNRLSAQSHLTRAVAGCVHSFRANISTKSYLPELRPCPSDRASLATAGAWRRDEPNDRSGLGQD